MKNHSRIISILLVCIFAALAFAADYDGPFYVSLTGDDSGTGAIDDPWATLVYAASAVKENGHEALAETHTVIIKSGTYVEELRPLVAGTTWMATAGAEVFITRAGAGDYCIRMSAGKNNVRLKNLNVHSANRAGIFFTGATDGFVEDCVVYNCTQEGLFFKLNSHRGLIKNTVVKNNGGIGINISNSLDMRIYNCTAYLNTLQGYVIQNDSQGFVLNNCISNGNDGVEYDVSPGAAASSAALNNCLGEGSYGVNWLEAWKVNDVAKDPLLLADGIHIPANSPCINSGSTIENVTQDIDGNTVPFGLLHDIGAHEYSIDTRRGVVQEILYPSMKRLIVNWTTGVNGTVIVEATGPYTGQVFAASTKPSSVTAPELNYDVTALDDFGIDILNGNLINRSASLEVVASSTLGIIVGDRMRLSISGAGAGRAGTVTINLR